jgi:FkbH-like protein
MMDGSGRPRDFRVELAAAAMLDLDARLEQLAGLAARDLSLIETIQLDKAVRAVPPGEQASYTAVRLAVLGSTTIDHLLPAIRVAGLRRHLLIGASGGGYGQYRQEILGTDSPLTTLEPNVLLLSLSSTELVRGIPVTAAKVDADRAVRQAVADLRDLWRTARQRFGVAVVQQSFLDTTQPVFGSHERLIAGAPSRLVGRLNDELADSAASDGVLLLDVAAASARDGIDAWFDARHWLQGKMEIAPGAAGRYAELLTRLLGAQYGKSKKCLVLDLDNTLWGGVIGDEGLGGIKLGEGSAVGEAHLALQKYAKQLKERGVILAICSKNEPAIVEEAFDKHPEMHLRRSDVAVFAVNWNDKAENLRQIAQRLNLGLDSLVFVDDNPVERARIRESLPMVAVPDLPDDPAYYVRALAGAGYFETITLTDEDRQRAEQYTADAERDALRETSQTVDDFLRGLRMQVVFGPITSVDIARSAQLINKTNQFNTTTRRSTADELAQWTADARNMTLQFRLVDRFGDNGLVSVMLFAGDAARPETLELANWVMSCRVFGRQLEHEALNIAVEAARARGVRTFVAEHKPTEKNAVIKDLFANLGFERMPDGTGAAGSTRWSLRLDAYEPHATQIARTGTQ